MTTFLDRIKLGITAFREAYLTSSVIDTEDWNEQRARRLRYQVLWAQYEQTSYRDIHSWATAYRKKYALYKYARPIYNPAYRLGEFWKAHLFGGLLDMEAGEQGAIPILTDNENLRLAIAELWKWSRWQVQKDTLAVRGTILGDAIIQVVDDVSRGRVYLSLLYPGDFESVNLDVFGNVKGYVIQVARPDPRGGSRMVTYREEVTRPDSQQVLYRTFLNGQPYAWPENVNRSWEAYSEWTEPYTFVPLVVIQHNDVGLDWGWSELHPIRAKVQEVDDLASLISDQIRKTVDPVWLMKGMKKVSLSLTGAADDDDTDRPAPGREELQALWGIPVDGGAEAMVADLKLENVLLHLASIVKEIERDVLELSADIHTSSGDASGRALRTARQPVVSKVVQRRVNYEGALVAAQQMAIAIAGWRGYYAGFDLNSYAKGDLDHTIAPRSVFERDPLDASEIDTAFWQAANAAIKVGVSLEGYLREQGWDDERIAKMIAEQPKEENLPDL